MIKSVEANIKESLFDVAGLATVKSAKGMSRRKIMSDLLYYMRKCLKLARRAQTISEGAEDLELQRMYEEVEALGKEIDLVEKSFE